jgi:cyclopropane-fatty-acyl-phospholipid synthase
VRAKFGEHFVRMWRLYLSGSIAAFKAGDLQLFQVVVAPRENNDVPRTRVHLYGG